MHLITTKRLVALVVCALALVAGCVVGQSINDEHLVNPDTAIGEEHDYNYPVADTIQYTEEALRGDGILFEVQSDNSIITEWRSADPNTPVSTFDRFVGHKPRYRYEITAIPQGGPRTRLIVNVRTEYIPDETQASYKADNRFALFKEIDELASKYPAPSKLPASGGVNFTLLPNEDLKALAKRATGDEKNWSVIAKDNGLTLPTDVSPFQNIWVPNNLLKQAAH